MNRSASRLGAALGVAALITMASAPAYAATIVSQSSANALTIGIAGSPADSGTVTATNDGSGEKIQGETNPPIDVLDNQKLLNVGVLAQQATARVANNGDGNSAACAGVAGNGGSVAQIGESSCINPGDPIGVSIANLDLTGVVLIDPASALGPLDPLNELGDVLVGPLTQALSDGLAPLGDTGLGGTLGAVEARCTASPGTASGTANIVDSRLTLSVSGTEVVLANLPANPPPNTDVLVNLDVVGDMLLTTLETNFNDALDGALTPLTEPLIEGIREPLVDGLLAQIAPQLEPLSENILRVILNEQTGSNGRIEVTAISLDLLPAAQEFADAPLVSADIANVTCGPNGRFVSDPEDPKTPKNPKDPKDPKLPEIPTVVASGVAGEPTNTTQNALTALAALMVLATTAGVLGLRRRLTE
ncbi:hypothetical protein [Nocardioides sp.]|uniref:hypothetical protein n=1 Tax=Nocardioides sp. TaxID=35761 RepID=UPI002734E6BB|nr:hypothetical protein [Nocardioides sp.]MDP3892701.1 hypothetical protein [Nocardioides sp.]